MVTRNKSITVTGLHMLLQLAGKSFQAPKYHLNINFVEDTKCLPKLIKTADRILWVNYGHALDPESFEKVFDPSIPEVLVFPSVVEGINWDRFRTCVRNKSKEPLNQIGLNFDTEVGPKMSDGIYTVRSTNPSIFIIDCKPVDKKLRTKKGEGIKLPRDVDLIFAKLQENDVKIGAWVKANVMVHLTHECLGNIMEATGVVCRPDT
jgi:hypothetical protein